MRHIVYKPLDRPDVEVLVDELWCPGELRAWRQHEDETWTADVQYRPPGGSSSFIASFAADEVRADTVDRSYGRALPTGPGRDPG